MQDIELDRIHSIQSSLAIQMPEYLENQEPPSQTSSAMKNTVQFRFRNNKTLQMIAGIGGNVLEWYDFAVFGYFSDVLGKVFFPPQEGLAAMIESFSVFGLAFLCRPVGGVLLGYIGDVYGRKRALEISIFLMALPTFLMGCLPSYDMVGSLSIVLLIAVRMLQGLSVGGQLVTSLVYTCENHPRSHWGYYGSMVMASANFGTLLGGLMAFFLRSNLKEDELVEWGWRLPFLSGILVSICGVYLKYFCDDDEMETFHGETPSTNPLLAAFAKDNLTTLLAATLVPMIWASGFYIIFVWMAIFMDEIVDPPIPGAFGVNSGALFLSVCLLFPVAGGLSDVFGRKTTMCVGCLGLAALCPGLIMLISDGKQSIIGMNVSAAAFFAQFTLGIFLSCYGAPMCAWLVESFPKPIRLTSVAIGYNIANGTVGGSSPALATYLAERFGNYAPGLMISFIALISFIGLMIAPSNQSVAEATTNDDLQIEIPEFHRRRPTMDSTKAVSQNELVEPEPGTHVTGPSLRPNDAILFTVDNSEFKMNDGTIGREQGIARIAEGDDSYISYDHDSERNNDDMSFGISETDNESTRGELI